MTVPTNRPVGRVPGKVEVRWRLIGAVIINGGLWVAIFLTAKGCAS